MEKIKIGIIGMGRLGRAVQTVVSSRNDMEVVNIFTRDNAHTIEEYIGKFDVLFVCVGSKADAPMLVPNLAKNFTIIDSFDTHDEFPNYIEKIKKSQGDGQIAITGTGWDPGLFSVMRIYFEAILPNASVETYWGAGVSLGHSNAIREISGVTDAIQFTIPSKKSLKKTLSGEVTSANEKHTRLCYVVATLSNRTRIANEIKTMPNYFAGQKTIVKFISKKKFAKRFLSRSEHGGHVITVDKFAKMHFRLRLKSNPYFTAQNMIAYASAIVQMKKENLSGVYTVFDIAPKYLFKKPRLDIL